MITKAKNYLKNLALAGTGIGAALILNLNAAYATTISSRLTPVFALAESELVTIGIRIGVIALIICGIKWIAASEAQSAKSAKDWAIKIFIGLVILVLAREIVPLFADTIAGTGTPQGPTV